ncbi:hypothetical protein H0H87_005413 [Tephrocybe sp. NHM501043]|nr:hypothetical protein H0H87_005413 [Tephrocybe sp. NHM501043]
MAIQKDLIDLLQSPSFRCLDLRNITNFPITQILGPNPQVKNLILWRGPLDTTLLETSAEANDVSRDDGLSVTTPAQAITHLESLRTVAPSIALQLLDMHSHPLQPLSLSSLRHFNCVARDDNALTVIQRVIDISATHLRDLELGYYTDGMTNVHNFISHDPQPHLPELFWKHFQDLSRLHALTYLNLPVRSDSLNSIQWCFRAIESIPLDNNLAEVTLRAYGPIQTFHSSWQAIDELLTRERHLTTLRIVRLEMENLPGITGHDVEAPLMDDLFPGLAMKGLVAYRRTRQQEPCSGILPEPVHILWTMAKIVFGTNP